jgi:SAM-dependent methyltransferase
MDENEIRKFVREKYAGIARKGGSCCEAGELCCGNFTPESASGKVGYSAEEIGGVPEGANMGLGCGNPVALASLKKGETVLDLGAGGGFDCFLASKEVGPAGRVIGVDMTPDMVEKARGNARRHGYENVEFRLGEIEHLPAADASVDAVISNCVINLSTDKESVFSEIYRVLKPGGRIMISDLVLVKTLPEDVANSLAAYAGCVAGAIGKDDYIRLMMMAGFRDVRIVQEKGYDGMSGLEDVSDAVRSVSIFGAKPE